MEQMAALKAAESIVERVQGYSAPNLDTRHDGLRRALHDSAFAMLALVGDREIIYLAHDLTEDDSDGSWAGRILAMTDREILESSVRAPRNGDGGTRVTLRPRRLIESIAVVKVARPEYGVEWPSKVEIEMTLEGETLTLPLGSNSSGAHLLGVAYKDLLELLPGLIEDSLAR